MPDQAGSKRSPKYRGFGISQVGHRVHIINAMRTHTALLIVIINQP